MLDQDTLEKSLKEALPREFHGQIVDIIKIITRLYNDNNISNNNNQAGSQNLEGQEIKSGQTLLSFGSSMQSGDLNIRDLVNGNSITINVNRFMNDSLSKEKGDDLSSTASNGRSQELIANKTKSLIGGFLVFLFVAGVLADVTGAYSGLREAIINFTNPTNIAQPITRTTSSLNSATPTISPSSISVTPSTTAGTFQSSLTPISDTTHKFAWFDGEIDSGLFLPSYDATRQLDNDSLYITGNNTGDVVWIAKDLPVYFTVEMKFVSLENDCEAVIGFGTGTQWRPAYVASFSSDHVDLEKYKSGDDWLHRINTTSTSNYDDTKNTANSIKLQRTDTWLGVFANDILALEAPKGVDKELDDLSEYNRLLIGVRSRTLDKICKLQIVSLALTSP